MRFRFFNNSEPVVPFFRDLVPHLIENGVHVDIVVSKALYRAGQPLREHFRDTPGVRILETPSFGASPSSAAGKFVVSVWYVKFAAIRSLFGRSVDLNVFLTQPPLFGLWGYVLRLFRHQPYVCVLMDIYPHLLAALDFMPRDSFRFRMALAIARHTLRNAEKIVIIGRCMRERVIDLGVASEKIHFAANWTDYDALFPVSHDDNTFRCSQEWRNRFVVMYAGNIGYPQAFGDLLAAAKTLNGRDDIQFVFVGGGARGAHVQATATELGLTNVAFLPFQHSRHTLSQIMSAADLHFVTLRDECVGLAVPSKAYSAFAAGRPVLYQGAAEGEIAMLVREHSAGTVLPTGRPDRLAEAIRHYADDRDGWAKECEAARALANLNRKGRVSVLRLAEVFDEASATSNPRRRRATN